MIFSYGITQQGTYHVKNDIVCQDYHSIIKMSDNFIIAAVADGLGSEKHSDIASKIAANSSTTYCSKNISITSSDEEIERVIRDSFTLALQEIENKAKENKHDIDQYDTTLTLAVVRENLLYYGHSGDSGIIVLNEAGLYEKVTEQQRDEDSHVFPLCFGNDKWIFGKYSSPVASVLLATDGIFESLFPIYIRDEKVNIHIALARYLMDASVLKIEEYGEKDTCARISMFVDNIPEDKVNDDKTVVVLVNMNIKSKIQPDEYYQEPNWLELKRKRDEEWKREAYPHLFKESEDKAETLESDPQNNLEVKNTGLSTVN